MQKKTHLFSKNKITCKRCYTGRSVADLDYMGTQLLKHNKRSTLTPRKFELPISQPDNPTQVSPKIDHLPSASDT